MGGTFGAETAEFYAKFRRGYPDAVVDAVVDRLGLSPADTVIDLGCGTGHLTRPLAQRVGMVVGVDPEADMLEAARRSTGGDLRSNVIWVLGSDTDIPMFRRLMGDGEVAAITIGQALHFMDHTRLFREARPLVRVGGGLAVIANGIPLWQQDSEWSRALHRALGEWFQTTPTAMCGTDRETQARYAEALTAAGYDVHEVAHEYNDELDVEQVLGGLYSALSPDELPVERRAAFAHHITRALPTGPPFTEVVRVIAQIGVAA
jgi:trans-aconitate methyltransferase